MSFLFKAPQIPTPPPLEMPKTEDVPDAEDAARKAQEAEDMRRRNRNRKGRRSTILTSPDCTSFDCANRRIKTSNSITNENAITDVTIVKDTES